MAKKYGSLLTNVLNGDGQSRAPGTSVNAAMRVRVIDRQLRAKAVFGDAAGDRTGDAGRLSDQHLGSGMDAGQRQKGCSAKQAHVHVNFS